MQQSDVQTEEGRHYPISTWFKLKGAFVRGEGTLDVLAVKHGVNPESARTKSHKEKWGKQRAKWLATQEQRLLAEATSEADVDQLREPSKPGDHVTTTEQQIANVDNALMAAMTARDIADLAKAKLVLLECLSIAKHGGKLTPVKNTRRRPGQQFSEPIPQPVASPAEPQNGPSASDSQSDT